MQRAALLSDAAAPAPSRVRAVVRAMRPVQWAKNALVFLPVLLAHHVGNPRLLVDALLAFAALSLCASGTYVVNDLLDRERDRLHPVKRRRPFASGALSAPTGWTMAPVLVAAAFGVAALLPPAFALVLGLYLATTVAYSFVLKRVAALDVVVLAGLYALRVLAGSAATGVPISEWLLAFCLFFFLDLALLKRYAELRLLETLEEARNNGRGYGVDDAAMLRGLGPATGYLAVLVLALYITSPAVAALYRTPQLLWLAAPLLLFWTTRMWLLAHRRDMPDDPVLFTVKDPVSWGVVGLVAVVVGAAATLTLG